MNKFSLLVFALLAVSSVSAFGTQYYETDSSLENSITPVTDSGCSSRCYRKATLEDMKVAEDISAYAFHVLGATTGQNFGDHDTIRKLLYRNFTKIYTCDAYMEVEFPPATTQKIRSEPPGPEGFINLWFAVTNNGTSTELYNFGHLTSRDAAPRASLQDSNCMCRDTALVSVSGVNDGLVYSIVDGETLCRKFRVQVTWLVEVRRDARGNLKAKIRRIYELVNAFLVYADCPAMQMIRPFRLLEPEPSYIY